MPDASLGERDTHPDTVRARLEAIRDRHYKVQWIEQNNLGADDSCSHGGDGEWNLHSWPCPDYSDAVAALAQLDAAEVEMFWDNETEYTHANPLRLRLVPDPVESSPGAPRSNT